MSNSFPYEVIDHLTLLKLWIFYKKVFEEHLITWQNKLELCVMNYAPSVISNSF